MQFRRASTLAVTFENGDIVIHNFFMKERFSCSAECLAFLSGMDDWKSPEELFSAFPDLDRESLAEQITQLVELNAVIVAGTPEADKDEKYRQEWQWGIVAGYFHFAIRNTQFLVGEPARELIKKRKAWRKSPELYQVNTGADDLVILPPTDLSQEPFALMRRRRSRRDFLDVPVSKQAIADCLYCGNGIVDFYEDEDYGRLPITMTPSGGARNPFELYIYARNVEGLQPGFYHYDALNHNLQSTHIGRVDVPPMLGGQNWPAQAAAIVFFVAHFPRSMWKYHLAMAYRVVMMEAGFIAQNIALTATHYGLSAIPSGAIDETLIEGYLGNPAVESGVVLTISIGKPGESQGWSGS